MKVSEFYKPHPKSPIKWTQGETEQHHAGPCYHCMAAKVGGGKSERRNKEKMAIKNTLAKHKK